MSDLTEALQEVIEGCDSMVATLDASQHAGEYAWNMNARIRGVRTSLNDAKSIAEEILKDISQRVYLVQVTTSVDMNIKVLAKNEDDAIEFACSTVDHRIEDNLTGLFDCYFDSVGEVLGHESEKDDDAEVEYPYGD